MRRSLYGLCVFGLLFSLPGEESVVPVDLIYRDGRVEKGRLAGWSGQAPLLEGEGKKEGLMALRFPPEESAVRVRGAGRLEDWHIYSGMEVRSDGDQGLLLRYAKDSPKVVLRRLELLPDRFVYRVRLQRIEGRRVQVDFFAPESGYRKPGMLGVGFYDGKVSVQQHGTMRRLMRDFDYAVPEWKDGVVELEVLGDRAAGKMGLRINQGAPIFWSLREDEFPPAGGHTLRIRPVDQTGELRVEDILLMEVRGFMTEEVTGPFPVWDLRNGDRIRGAAEAKAAGTIRLDPGDGREIPLSVRALDMVWFSKPEQGP